MLIGLVHAEPRRILAREPQIRLVVPATRRHGVHARVLDTLSHVWSPVLMLSLAEVTHCLGVLGCSTRSLLLLDVAEAVRIEQQTGLVHLLLHEAERRVARLPDLLGVGGTRS